MLLEMLTREPQARQSATARPERFARRSQAMRTHRARRLRAPQIIPPGMHPDRAAEIIRRELILLPPILFLAALILGVVWTMLPN